MCEDSVNVSVGVDVRGDLCEACYICQKSV